MKKVTGLFYFIILAFTLSCQPSSTEDKTGPMRLPPTQENPLQPPTTSSPPVQNDNRPVALPKGTAEEVAIPFDSIANLNASRIPTWPGTIEQLHAFVKHSYDVRLYPNPNPGESLRRAPWYYGEGCYAKAAHISALAEENGYPRAGKVFAFGGWATMRVKSKYIPGGAAWWNYHVVASYQIKSQVFVLDPLFSAERALTVDEWIRAIAPHPEKISLSFCDQNIYLPTDRCLGGNRDGTFTGHIPEMLREEYRILQGLGYDPTTLL